MKKYVIANEERVFKTPRMEGVKRTLTATDGSDEFTHTIIKSEPSIATIVRSEDGKIAFIKQLRSTVNQYFLEIPAGLRNPGEESMLDVSRREVREETGMLLKDVRLVVNGPSLLDPSKSDEDFGVAEATACGQKARCLDENERISSDIIWIDEADVFVRLREQLSEGKPFYDGLFLSGHTVYALLAYNFLH
ncbi:MAG: NUDIX hydrolase [Clostridia bacterium]|nr:NUDIX hydrolase [Clostridia bacterium]